MFSIEILIAGDWKTASTHSQLIDAQVQWDRFISFGTDAATMRRVGWTA